MFALYDGINNSTHLPTLKVESEDKFERIGGSSIGGGTFWGLGALLTKTKVSAFDITFTGGTVFPTDSLLNLSIEIR